MSDPIRILHVVTYMGRGGLETMLMNYYRQIDRTQVQFDFLVHRDFRADYDDEIEALGGKIYRLPRLVPWSRSYHRALDAFLDAHREYRIVHVHQDCLSSVILKAAREHGIPVRIAHSHNSNQDHNLRYLVKLFYMRAIPTCATALFACGKEAGDWMFRGAPYCILQNAIHPEDYLPNPAVRARMRGALGLTDHALVLGHVGRFSPQKNHGYLLDIFSAVHTKCPDSRLLLVGEGDGRPTAEEKASQLGLGNAVLFTGVRTDVPALMQAMDVFVFPSLYEGLPVTMVEAQAAGLPCVISNGVPLECAVSDAVVQLSLEQSPEAWAEAILAFRGQPRQNNLERIRSAGLDITSSAEWLQNYYLEQWEAADQCHS